MRRDISREGVHVSVELGLCYDIEVCVRVRVAEGADGFDHDGLKTVSIVRDVKGLSLVDWEEARHTSLTPSHLVKQYGVGNARVSIGAEFSRARWTGEAAAKLEAVTAIRVKRVEDSIADEHRGDGLLD